MHTCIPYPNKIHLTITLITNNKNVLFLALYHLIKQIVLDSLCQQKEINIRYFKKFFCKHYRKQPSINYKLPWIPAYDPLITLIICSKPNRRFLCVIKSVTGGYLTTPILIRHLIFLILQTSFRHIVSKSCHPKSIIMQLSLKRNILILSLSIKSVIDLSDNPHSSGGL